MSNRNYRNYQNYQKEKEQTPDPEPTDNTEDTVGLEPADKTEEENETVVVETNVPIENIFGAAINPEPAKTEIGKVNCIRLKIRNKPSMGGSIVCLARVGDELTIDRSKFYDGWLKVTTVDGLEGFCRQDFVTVI